MLPKPSRLIWIAVALMLTGACLPFLMVIHVLEPTMFLAFVSFVSQTLGFILGFVGLAVYQAGKNSKQ
jgi:hypothetical protein